jgi:2-keto-4-pentenoate hydratase/2-oxohepta-3-ene-1,7-dioic acid hydratase in catechol pathway
MMTNGTTVRCVSPRIAFCAVLVAALTTFTAAQQPPRSGPIFRLATFQTNGDLRLGATQGNGESDIVDIHNAVRALLALGAPESRNLSYIPADMKTLIEVGDSGVAAVKTVYRAALAHKASGKLVDPGGEARVFYPHTAVRLRAPIPNPRQLFGMAGNYRREGAPETARTPAAAPRPAAAPAGGQGGLGRAPNPALPSFFLKSVAGIVGPDDEIVMTDLLKDGYPNTHEAELAFVIGKRAKNVSESAALDYVFGYTVHNDVSGRTLETGASSSEGSSMTKGMDTFAPLGPYLTLKEDVPDPYNLAIETKLNGKVFPMPNAHTKYMEHRIPAALSLLSRIMTLEPGDVVATGVPAPTAPLVPGDTVEITIERLGTLRNRIVKKATGSTF